MSCIHVGAHHYLPPSFWHYPPHAAGCSSPSGTLLTTAPEGAGVPGSPEAGVAVEETVGEVGVDRSAVAGPSWWDWPVCHPF